MSVYGKAKTGIMCSTWRKLSRCHFVHKNGDGLGSKPGFLDKTPSTNGLSHGRAIEFQLSRLCAVTYTNTVIFVVDLGNGNTTFAVNLEIYTFNQTMTKVY